MRLRRTLTVAVLAAIAVSGLSACQNKVGVAASVAGERLSDSQLSTYVKPGAAPYADQSGTGTVVPKVYAVQNWVEDRLFARAVANKGGPATKAELLSARAAVLAGRPIAQAESFYGKLGYRRKFADLIITQSATLVVLVQRLVPGASATQAISALQNNQAGSLLLKAVNAAKSKVTVSPRYGTWDPRTVSLTSTAGVGAPAFVRFPTSAPAGAQSAAAP